MHTASRAHTHTHTGPCTRLDMHTRFTRGCAASTCQASRSAWPRWRRLTGVPTVYMEERTESHFRRGWDSGHLAPWRGSAPTPQTWTCCPGSPTRDPAPSTPSSTGGLSAQRHRREPGRREGQGADSSDPPPRESRGGRWRGRETARGRVSRENAPAPRAPPRWRSGAFDGTAHTFLGCQASPVRTPAPRLSPP